MQARVLERLVAAIDQPRAEVAPRSTRLSVSRYLDEGELAREREVLFARRPIVVAHASELAEVGAFRTDMLGDVPLLITRAQDGVHVFVNACRHRGARLVDAPAGCSKLLTCPYHAWTYRPDGRLFRVPGEDTFDALDHAALGLRELPSEVRHGLVWAQLDGQLDVASFLGPVLDDDLEAFDLAGHVALGRTDRVVSANWKLVMDAFAEGYHLSSLHSKSLARFFLEVSVLDDCAPHVRQVGARKTLLEVKGDASRADLRRDTTVFYDVFPNTVLVFHPDWLSALTVFPLDVDHVRVVHRMLAPDGPRDEDASQRLARSFAHIDEQVFLKEDLAIAESIQSTLASGANEHVLLGGLEEGMRLFHAARDAALEAALEAARQE